MWNACIDQISTITDHLDKECIKIITQKANSVKSLLLQSQIEVHRNLMMELSKVEEIGVIKSNNQIGTILDAQQLIVEETMDVLTNTIKSVMQNKIKMNQRNCDEIRKIAMHHGLMMIKSENQDPAVDIDNAQNQDIVEENNMESDDEETESEDDGSGNGTISSHHMDQTKYIPGIDLRCDVCHELFYFMSDFRNHMHLQHGVAKPFKCQVCGKGFDQKLYWKQHCNIHTNEKPYQCDQCGKRFNNKANHYNHVHTVHTDDRPFKCDDCGLCYKRKRDLKQHCIIHTNEKPYECDQCGKRFNNRGNHHTHIHTVHTDDRPFKCDECGSCFKRKCHLTTHFESIHKEVINYRCSFCSKGFYMKSHFNVHLRIHTGEKPFQCSTCNKEFAQKWNLTVHERLHSGEKPYECSKCHKRFSDGSYKNRHERKCAKIVR